VARLKFNRIPYKTRVQNDLIKKKNKKENKGQEKKENTPKNPRINLHVPALLMKNALCELSYECNKNNNNNVCISSP